MRAPAAAGLFVKGARGLIGDAYGLRPGVFEIISTIVVGYTPLKPGEETTISVEVDDLPANADVKSITARLLVADADDTGPAPPPHTATISRDGVTTTLQVTPGVITRPRNVSVRLDRGEPIWTFADTLLQDAYDLPDFAAQLNAYLDKASAAGSRMTLNFLVKSDTPGKATITIAAKDVTRLQTQTWTNDLDQTVRLDRNIDVDFGDRVLIPLDALTGNAAAKSVKLDVAGDIGPERLLGVVRPHDGRAFATVSADYAIGQQIVLDTDVEAAGLSLYLGADLETELYVELQPDDSGVPSSGVPLARANVTLAEDPTDGVSWVFAAFESAASLSADVACWLVVKGVKGSARVGLESRAGTYLAQLMVNRTGNLWKPFASPTQRDGGAMLRLVYVPGADNQSAGLQVALSGAAAQAVDPAATPASIALAPGSTPAVPAVVELTSHARGTLTVANVIQEY